MCMDKTRARPVLSVLMAGVMLTLLGGGKGPEPIPAGSFRAVVENVVHDDLVLVRGYPGAHPEYWSCCGPSGGLR